ncbi:MAG TPA: urea amidolyase, partial [Xanthobacteraceae bacterium]|nr:urea amidolyase [Xanthobacteraceae bacterium]
QLRPGAHVSFAAVTIEQAVAARRAETQALARPIARQPLVRTEFPSEFLLGLNLVDGVTADDGGLSC